MTRADEDCLADLLKALQVSVAEIIVVDTPRLIFTIEEFESDGGLRLTCSGEYVRLLRTLRPCVFLERQTPFRLRTALRAEFAWSGDHAQNLSVR